MGKFTGGCCDALLNIQLSALIAFFSARGMFIHDSGITINYKYKTVSVYFRLEIKKKRSGSKSEIVTRQVGLNEVKNGLISLESL